MARTRYTFNIVGKIIKNGSQTTFLYKVKSTTCTSRVIKHLCENTNTDFSQIKSIFIWCTNMTWSERYNLNLTDVQEGLSFRDLSLVGKKSISIIVNLDNVY